jgi:hypothetical protein
VNSSGFGRSGVTPEPTFSDGSVATYICSATREV